MKIRRLFGFVLPRRGAKFLVLSKFISSWDEVTWKPECLFHKLEEAKNYIKVETGRIGLPSWDFDIKRLTRGERREYRKQGLT